MATVASVAAISSITTSSRRESCGSLPPVTADATVTAGTSRTKNIVTYCSIFNNKGTVVIYGTLPSISSGAAVTAVAAVAATAAETSRQSRHTDRPCTRQLHELSSPNHTCGCGWVAIYILG
jgi:hypothetical protein